MNTCLKNCCKVGDILYCMSNEYDMEEIIDMYENELQKYDAYIEMQEIGGHINYVLPYYCVEIGHVNCLKYISKLPNFMYHNDLAMCAIDNDQLECLQYIVENCPDIYMIESLDDWDIGENCMEYVKELTKK